MKTSHSRRSRLAAVLAVAASLSLGCASPADSELSEDKRQEIVSTFNRDLTAATAELDQDRAFRRIPLDSKADQDWFIALAFRYWYKKIDAGQFVAEGVERFPGHRKSFEAVAAKLAR